MRVRLPSIAQAGQAESSPYLPEDRQKYAQPHAERINSLFDNIQTNQSTLRQCLDERSTFWLLYFNVGCP